MMGRLSNECVDLRPFERDRRPLGVVLVINVGVAGTGHDGLEVFRQARQPLQSALALGLETVTRCIHACHCDARTVRPPWVRENGRMDVLSSRIILRPRDLRRTQRFYRDTLGLAVCRQFGDPEAPGLVFYLGNGLLEVSGQVKDRPGQGVALWMQVRDVHAEYDRLLDAGVTVLREPRQEAWGLVECWIADPDEVRIVMVEVPDDHPLRQDQRGLSDLGG